MRGVEFQGNIVHHPFVFMAKVRRASLADRFDNFAWDSMLQRMGLVNIPGILRAGVARRYQDHQLDQPPLHLNARRK